MARLGGVLLLLGLLGACAGLPEEPMPEGPIGFNRHVRPILANACFQCHGPDPGSRKAKLRFDREDGFFAPREDGPTVVKGQPDRSPLYKRLVTADLEEVMPPPKSHKTLKTVEKKIVRKWIEEGAAWEPHWSFINPTRPPLPAVRNAAWGRTPIDAFILARLEAQGLAPAPEADKRTLARRLSLDLTGLPPEPADVDAFLADASADAVEKLIDRLQASPRYGEHRARFWMDAARYADTHGLHFDNFRDIWPYRDWIIRAFQRNQPFDQFTVEQLAGDLLPNPTREQQLATGFHRCNLTTNEGGSINEEVLVHYARERVETTSWVWLGLTANCAVCHDHKFDPITMRDFYSLSAFFRNTTQGAMDGNIRDTAPVLVLPQTADEKRWEEIPGQIAEAKKAAEERRQALRGDFDKWLEAAKPEDWDAEIAKIGDPDFLLPLNAEPKPEETLAGLLKGAPVSAKSAEPIKWTDGRQGKAMAFEGKAPLAVDGDVGPFEKDNPYSFGCWIQVQKGFAGAAPVFARMDDDDGFRGWDLWVQEGEFATHLVHKWKDDACKVATTGKQVKPGQWQHVFVTYDGSAKAKGFRIFIDGKEAKLNVEADTLKSTTKTQTPFLVGQRKKGGILNHALVQDIRIYGKKLEAQDVRRLALEAKAKALLAKAPKDRGNKEKDELFDVTVSSDPALAAATARAADLENERKGIRERASVGYVQEEKQGMGMANILFRGEYDKPRDKVEPTVFSFLHKLPENAPRNRLGLARWLVAPENPLTARVTVNRFWQEVFGTGLVKTSEDFGIMGEAPSHPELLDWLAVEFRESGWDVKKLFKLMLTSSAYRQAAVATKEKLEKDRENRLLSRGPRFRMDAEQIRDYALAASGLLSAKIGGPSVKPYQPEGVWEAVAMPGSNTRFYKPDTGESLYRRSMYTFWKRAAPPASMDILNAPAREFSCLRRERTNTPLQALVTLNDPQFVEAARALAERAMKAAPDDAGRTSQVALRALARPFSEKEAAVVAKSLAALKAHYAAKPDDAKALLAVGEHKSDPALPPAELAAWTMLCNQVLNLDEVLNK